MKIGIIGSGNVGGTLGTRWAKNGHNVMFATREAGSAKMTKLLASAPGAGSGTVEAVARVSDVLLLAIPWSAAEEALKSAGDLSGKIIIDAINPVLPDLSGLAIGTTSSAGEMVASWTPGAKVVKALNTVGYYVMADPTFAQGPVTMLYCGDDADAKKTVAPLIAELGFDPLDAGPLSQARLLEPFAMLWISLAMKQGYGRDIAFRFIRRAG